MKENIKENIFTLSDEEKRIEENVKKLLELIKEMKGKINFHEETIYRTISRLKKEYSAAEAEKYYLYHLIIGSTPRLEECLYFDFPGDDSIYKTLQDELRESLSKF